MTAPVELEVIGARKRPVAVKAARWDGSVKGATAVIDWILANGGTARYRDDPPSLSIDTLEGTMTARSGWWVIRGVAGEFYGCEPGIFDRTYEQADGPVAPGAREALEDAARAAVTEAAKCRNSTRPCRDCERNVREVMTAADAFAKAEAEPARELLGGDGEARDE